MRLELIIFSDCKINVCHLKTMKRCVLIDLMMDFSNISIEN